MNSTDTLLTEIKQRSTVLVTIEIGPADSFAEVFDDFSRSAAVVPYVAPTLTGLAERLVALRAAEPPSCGSARTRPNMPHYGECGWRPSTPSCRPE
jgi:hypothetical protein